jgi:para-nitrobenzyl esterase
MSDPIVSTTEGAVRGRITDIAHVFLDIPYAAPPIGSARFTAPGPHQPWPGVRDATRPGPTAPQPRRAGFGKLDMSPYFGPGWVPGPDYLTVTVWTPPQARTSPVMAFVHGGGFVSGSSRAPLYDGTAFARDGVVLVTVNYRLGIAGFLDLPGAPANRGMLDIVAALRWVRRNIAAFGGDPGNVTCSDSPPGPRSSVDYWQHPRLPACSTAPLCRAATAPVRSLPNRPHGSPAQRSAPSESGRQQQISPISPTIVSSHWCRS